MINKGAVVNRIYSLDFLRILAIVGILIYHFQQIFDYTPAYFPNLHTGNFNASYLVEFFFILSGFLSLRDSKRLLGNSSVSNNADAVSLASYIKQKAKRLLPVIFLPCIAYTVISYIFRSMLGNGGWYFDTVVDIPGTILATLGMQFWGLFETNPVNYPLWYVDILLLCYIVMGIIIKLFKRMKINPSYGYTVMIFLGIALWNYEIEIPFFNMCASRGYTAFFLGLMLAEYANNRSFTAASSADQKAASSKCNNVVYLISLLFIAVISFAVTVLKPDWFGTYDKYMYTFFTYPALILLFSSNTVSRFFKAKIIGTMGKVSYDVFAWHLNVYFVVALLDKASVISFTPSYGTMWLLTLISIVVGSISYFIRNSLPRLQGE